MKQISPTAKKILNAAAIVLVILFVYYKWGYMLSAGSYPSAERYELDYPEDKVIAAINQLKTSDSTVVPPYGREYEGRRNKPDQHHWYFAYFYDTATRRMLLTWTRPKTVTKTTFAFVSVGNFGAWKDVNEDFGFFENRRIIKHFEENILRRIKQNLANNNGGK